MRITIKTVVIFVGLAVSAHGRIINVPADYPTIQAGIDASVNGDTVLVAPGEYEGDFTINGRNVLLTSSHGPDTTFIAGSCALQSGSPFLQEFIEPLSNPVQAGEATIGPSAAR